MTGIKFYHKPRQGPWISQILYIFFVNQLFICTNKRKTNKRDDDSGVKCQFQQYFSNIVAVSFIVWRNRSTRRNLQTCSIFLLTIYLLSLVGEFFNRESAFPWVQTVFFLSQICSFIRMRQTSYRVFLRKTKGS